MKAQITINIPRSDVMGVAAQLNQHNVDNWVIQTEGTLIFERRGSDAVDDLVRELETLPDGYLADKVGSFLVSGKYSTLWKHAYPELLTFGELLNAAAEETLKRAAEHLAERADIDDWSWFTPSLHDGWANSWGADGVLYRLEMLVEWLLAVYEERA